MQTCSNEGCLQAALRTGPAQQQQTQGRQQTKPGSSKPGELQRPPQQLLLTVTPRPGFTTLNSSSKYLTSRTKAYYVSNVQCNTTQLLEGPGSVIVCVTYYIASLDNSIVKIMSCTQHTNSSKINNIIAYNKYSKHLLKKIRRYINIAMH